MASATSLSLSILKPKSLFPSLQFTSSHSFPHLKRFSILHTSSLTTTTTTRGSRTHEALQSWKIHAASADTVTSEITKTVENSQDIVTSSSSDDGASTIISVLLFVGFIALTILTIGVIYLGVTDFLQKREKEKFEKEEAAKKKKGGKKRRVRARAGPRGFGQKIDVDDDDD